MKVVMISRGFCDYLIGLLNALSSKVELYFIVSKADEWIVEYLNKDVNVIYAKTPNVSSMKNLFGMYKMVREIRKISPDIIHFQSGIVWENLIFKSIKSKFVTTVHDIVKHPTRTKMRYIPQCVLDISVTQSDAIIVHGESLRKRAQKIFNLKNIYSIDHGVIQRYGSGKAKIEIQTKNILFFGFIDKWKGIEILVKATPIIAKEIPDVKIKIAGGTGKREYYKTLLEGEPIIDADLSRQSHEQVAILFQWADVLVLPYIEASQSGVLQLGMAFGVPPVVTNVGGLPDVIKNEKTGLIVEPENSEELAHAVIRLLIDTKLREIVISNLCKERSTRFNWNCLAEKTYQVYKTVVHSD